jgi:hypothetical protein
MADNSGAVGMMGILIGVMIVVVLGGALLFANGHLGNQSTVKVELPKVSGTR